MFARNTSSQAHGLRWLWSSQISYCLIIPHMICKKVKATSTRFSNFLLLDYLSLALFVAQYISQYNFLIFLKQILSSSLEPINR